MFPALLLTPNKMHYFFLFIIICFAVSSIRGQRFCNGVYCDSNCANCYPCQQEINCMIANNCYCAKKAIPGNLSLSETPQFFFFTIDDSIKTANFVNALKSLDFILKNSSIVDSMGCSPKISSYVIGDGVDFNMVNYLDQTGSVSVHSQTHTTNLNTTADVWAAELQTEIRNIQELAKVKKIKGSRAPFLEINDAYLSEIQKYGIIYDSSMIYGWNYVKNDQNESYWPFTLDYGVPDQMMCLYLGNCPIQTHAGLWEFPIISMNTGTDLMDYNVLTDYAGQMTAFKQNFLNSYNYNKVPRGYYIHWRYFSNNGDFEALNTTRVEFLLEFFGWLTSTFPDIIFTTEDKVIDWIKNPQTTTITKTQSAFQCSNQSLTPYNSCPSGQITCNYGANPLIVCGKKCPQPFPKLSIQWTYQKTNLKYNHWLGTLIVTLRDSWPSGFCANISMIHAGSSPVVSWILSESNLVSMGNVTAFWGFVQKTLNIDSVSQIYRQIGFGVSIPPNIPTVIGGWCMTTNLVGSYDSNWIANNVRFGIDLYDKTLDCPLEGCAIFCGNGRCDSSEGEKITNCPFDCAKFACPNNRRLLWNKWLN